MEPRRREPRAAAEGAPTLDVPRTVGSRRRTTSTPRSARDLDALGPRRRSGATGRAGSPSPRREALAARRHFVRHRLGAFGPYEDAILADDWAMAHSLLSVPLNLGLLDPLETAAAAEHAYRRGDVGLDAAEGFVRQVIGWREYVWHLYWHLGPDYRRRNALRAPGARCPTGSPSSTPTPSTAACLRTALEGVRDRGWTHHIQRLMVLGNHALQRGYDPDALTEWFQTAFVDGFDWVMPVNVIGMSQHADGGLIATKPYASGGAYINRMSDHCKGCAFDPRRRVGERRLPVHRRLLGVGPPPPGAPRREQPHRAGPSRRCTARRPRRRRGPGGPPPRVLITAGIVPVS